MDGEQCTWPRTGPRTEIERPAIGQGELNSPRPHGRSESSKLAKTSSGAIEPRRPLLDTLRGHDELARIPSVLLPQLAQEIRGKIHEVISRTPGHYASNLGIVELTIALHRAFDFRRDRLVLDVGHQCYPHKMLTGRASRFHALRQEHGLCGFPHPEESPDYDLFNTSHAGCAGSSVLGLAVADRMLGRDGRSVAVVGDGAITSGIAYEALNHAGHLKEDLLVIFNDNGCSISYNTGGLSDACARLRREPFISVASVAGRVWSEVESLPQIGPALAAALSEAGAKTGRVEALPGDFFRSLGFEYFGPVDGHDLETLGDWLETLKRHGGPRLLHVITRKGRGFPWSEKDPVTWHAGKPYEVKGSTAIVRKPSQPRPPDYTEVVSGAILEAAREERRVVALTAAMAEGTGLKKFQVAFPERFFDVGISEQHAVCFAAAMAKGGLRPVVCIYSSFLQRGFDQLMHDVSLQCSSTAGALPAVLFCLDRAGLVGDDGPTAHGVFDLAYLRPLPHFILLAPKDGVEAAAMVRWALRETRPVAIRIPKEPIPAAALAPELAPIALGKGEILREGERFAFLAYGSEVAQAARAAEILERDHGLRVTVANARFAKPLDGDLIEKLLRTHERVLTVEEHQLQGGFGSAVLEEANARRLDSSGLVRIGIADRFIPFGSRPWQLRECGLDAESLAQRVRALAAGGD